ncbi:MAG: hypothetical protein WCV79_02585 [Candidatus Paceibacterota bacterium]|jgi:hypothetical protein
MKILVFLQPAGDFLVLPESQTYTSQTQMWGRDPFRVITIDFGEDEEFATAVVATITHKPWSNGHVGNIVTGILNAVFKEGFRYGYQKCEMSKKKAVA